MQLILNFPYFRGQYHDDPNRKSQPRTSGISGTGYDRWSYEQAARREAGANDTPLNKLQYKFWVTKSKVVRKLGKDEDECVVASDAELDAKLELYHSISETTKDLQRILDQYNDRLCSKYSFKYVKEQNVFNYFVVDLAYEENSFGRFLKDFGKLEKTKTGKIMMASGKAVSYSSQQRLALRPSIIRLAEEVDTFRFRAIEDTNDTVSSMEKVRTEYRGALMWMKNVSTELDPDTYKQLEKFRKVQGHVKTSKVKFDRLKVDCIQKIDLLAAARCNMYSHALVMYQDALIHFSEKVAKTFSHVESSFKGYQPYEFQYIRELADPHKFLVPTKSKKKAKENTENTEEAKKVEEVEDEKYFFDLDTDKAELGQDALELAKESEASINNLLELEDDNKDDELLLHWEEQHKKGSENQDLLKGAEDLFKKSTDNDQTSLLDNLAGLDLGPSESPQDSPARFSAQWNKLFGQEPKPMDDNTVPDLNLGTLGTIQANDDDFGSFLQAAKPTENQSSDAILPSQLFDLDQSLFSLQSPRQGKNLF